MEIETNITSLPVDSGIGHLCYLRVQFNYHQMNRARKSILLTNAMERLNTNITIFAVTVNMNIAIRRKK